MLGKINVRSSASAADLIFEALKEAIFTGELKEGEHLRQDALAELFNASRIPVREALARLEQNGLAVTERFRGTTVAGLSPDEIRETFEFRALLEGDVIHHAVSQMSDEALADARRYSDAFVQETDPAKWSVLNRNFHNSLYRDANRPYYVHIIKSTIDRVERYLRAQIILTDGMQKAHNEHVGILNACIARDADLAAQLTRSHIRGASESLISVLEEKARESAST